MFKLTPEGRQRVDGMMMMSTQMMMMMMMIDKVQSVTLNSSHSMEHSRQVT